MPVARGNVSFDLSALSTSLAKRTGADEYAGDPLPPLDCETYINSLEKQNAELKDRLRDTTLVWVKAAEERDTLSEKVKAQEKQLVEQKQKLWERKVHNQHLEVLIKGLEEESSAPWLKEALRNYKEGRKGRSDDTAAQSQTEEAASSVSGENDDGGHDDVSMPLASRHQFVPPNEDLDEEDLDEPTPPLPEFKQAGERAAHVNEIHQILKIANDLENRIDSSLRKEHATLYDVMINRAHRALTNPDIATSELKHLAEWLDEDVSQLNNEFRNLEEDIKKDGIDPETGQKAPRSRKKTKPKRGAH